MKMVLRCISSCTMSSSAMHHKGPSGLKAVFWRKFRKRKAGSTKTVKKKRLTSTGTGNDEDVFGNSGGRKRDVEITTLTQEEQPSTVPKPQPPALIAVSGFVVVCRVKSGDDDAVGVLCIGRSFDFN